MISSRPPPSNPLGPLIGVDIPSEIVPGVSYRLVWQLGEGGMSIVFYALRVSAQGEVPVVVKMLRPSFAAKAGFTAALIVKKEAIALGRLNERVPPTPFVVRYIDTGTYALPYKGSSVEVPWVVVEYVHGGAEGTTLTERVDHSLRSTGAAFDPARASHAMECLASGLGAVHDVGVIHRDLKPDNVLCCGFGDGEIFKLADFGVARPVGVATFMGTVVGTPGFVAPELATGDPRAIGPWSDTFSLAAIVFFMLTGEDYFSARTPVEALTQAISEQRRSILDTKGLSPDLRAREAACRAIDRALALATAGKIQARAPRADVLAANLLPWLRGGSLRAGLLGRRLEALRTEVSALTPAPSTRRDGPARLAAWQWTAMRGFSGAEIFALRSVAWDGDGRAMAATNRGLAFWNGSAWIEVPGDKLPSATGIRFVQRVGPGRWLVGGDDATVATYTTEGVTDVRRLDHCPVARFDQVSGDFTDLAVLVGQSPGGPPTLCALAGKRWLKPLPLPDVAALTSLARIADAQWLLAGRGADGRGFVAVYSPLDWEVERLRGPNVRAYLAAAGSLDRELGVGTGAEGAVVLRRGRALQHETISTPDAFDLSACAVDVVGRIWAASAGRIWLRKDPEPDDPKFRWECMWEDPTWTVPIVSLTADLGGVGAMTADGGVIEGRAMKMTLVAE